MEKQQDNAIKSLKKAIELDPSKAYYHEEFFTKLHKINPEEALASIKRAIGLSSNRKSLYEDLIILLKKANYEETKDVYPIRFGTGITVSKRGYL